jgi:sigma-B regulation protein RsbU (phosphoserine phosphatase)
MNQRGIAFRLNSNLTTIAIIIIALIVFINYHFSNKILIGKIEEGAINQSNLVVSRISRVTVGTEEVAKNIAYQALYYNKNNDLDFFLNQVLKTNKILESVHVELFDVQKNKFLKFSSNKPGQLICNPDSLSVEEYFMKLKKENVNTNQGSWTDPFYCKYDTNHLLISYWHPIFNPDTKEISGIISCEISLNKMDKMLSEVKIGSNGYSFIIDQSGRIITHPKKEWILNKNLFEKPSLIFEENIEIVESQIKSGGKGAGNGISQYLDNQKAWFYFSPLPSSGWSAIIVVPEKELLKPIELIFQKMILVSGLGILILFLVNMLIFKRMLDPLVRIVFAIQRFSSADNQLNKSRNEILMLADSLENWQSKYGLLIKEQTKTANEKLKYEKDLKSAREIQFNIIPIGKPKFPEYPEIDLFAILKPAETVGGDLYDYFFIDKNHLLIAIGDVSGKGIPASLFMAITSTLIKTHAKMLSTKGIVTQVNHELSERNSNQYFVTLFIGILDISTGIMDYCNAAHDYPYILHADGTIQKLSKSHGLPLGIYKNKEYSSNQIELQLGDMIVLYTDGVINSKDDKNKHYGTERLEINIQNLIDLSSEEAANRIVKSIEIYEGEEKQSDDITLLTLRYLSSKKENQT